MKIIKVGQVSCKNSQGGTVYSIKGIAPTINAGTHGYSIGYIMVPKFSEDNKVNEMGGIDLAYDKVKLNPQIAPTVRAEHHNCLDVHFVSDTPRSTKHNKDNFKSKNTQYDPEYERSDNMESSGGNLKYFSMFSGIGGMESGILRAYRKKNRRSEQPNSNTNGGTAGADDKQVEGIQQGRDIKNLPNTKRSEFSSKPLCVGYSEINKYVIQIYEKQFKGHKNYGDCTKIKWGEVPDFDMLVGGVPCQSWSIAGKRKGFEDSRGTMWFEYFRCLSEKQPKFFVAENVKGILSHNKGKSFEEICVCFCELGYAIDFEVLNSKNFGVPQNRDRVFIIGIRLDLLDKRQVF